MLSSLKLSFSRTEFGTTKLCTIPFRADAGNKRKIKIVGNQMGKK